MEFTHLPFRAPLTQYQRQADELLDAFRAGDPAALKLAHNHHPKFLNDQVKWLPKPLSEQEIGQSSFDAGDARLTVSRCYNFRDWEALASYVAAVEQDGDVFRFESAVEAVIDGDLVRLAGLLSEDPSLAQARSTRITNFDPAVHQATLLHYLVANGVEDYRQRTPPNAIAIGTALLDAGADPDALANLYGGKCSVMSMLASSSHPANAGVQAGLIELFLDRGASAEPSGEGNWSSPLHTALVFCFRDAAETLARRGAVLTLPTAAGLGRADVVARLLPDASALSRHQALALAALNGQIEVTSQLLDAGEDPSRFNPEGHHAHATPLHQAALQGDKAMVKLLVERGARLDIQDKFWNATPLRWARYAGQSHVEEYLSS